MSTEPTPPSDTPETDAAISVYHHCAAVDIKVSRSLETRLHAAEAQLKEVTAAPGGLRAALIAKDAEIALWKTAYESKDARYCAALNEQADLRAQLATLRQPVDLAKVREEIRLIFHDIRHGVMDSTFGANAILTALAPWLRGTNAPWQTGMPPVSDGKERGFIAITESSVGASRHVRYLEYRNRFIGPCADGCEPREGTEVAGSDGEEFYWTGWFEPSCDQCDTFWAFSGTVVAWMELPAIDAAMTASAPLPAAVDSLEVSPPAKVTGAAPASNDGGPAAAGSTPDVLQPMKSKETYSISCPMCGYQHDTTNAGRKKLALEWEACISPAYVQQNAEIARLLKENREMHAKLYLREGPK